MSIEVIAERELALERCAYYHRQSKLAESRLVDNVDIARKAGCSWTEIGEALETSHQNVISRFASRVTKVDLRERTSARRAEVRETHGWKDPGDAT